MGHPVRREPPEFVVNEREQFMGGFGVAAFGGLEDLRDLAHGDPGVLKNTPN
jgi:hypothetical protein